MRGWELRSARAAYDEAGEVRRLEINRQLRAHMASEAGGGSALEGWGFVSRLLRRSAHPRPYVLVLPSDVLALMERA